MNIALWVLQILLALLCISGGAFQIFKLDELKKNVAAMRELPRGLWTFLGAFGIVAGLCLILPMAIGVLPVLTPIAAAGMAVHSLLISGFYLKFGDRPPLPYSVTMAILALVIAVGRFAL